MTTGLSDHTRSAVLDAARTAGEKAGRAYRDHGTSPRLPGGNLAGRGPIVRQYAVAWHHGFADVAGAVGKSLLVLLTKGDITAKVYAALSKVYPADTLQWVKQADWRYDEAVPLADIDMDRRPGGRDRKKVEGIAHAIADGMEMDPVVLVDTGDEHQLQIADGYHRTLAYRHAKQTTCSAYVASGVGEHGPWDREMHDRKLNKVGPKGYIHGWIFVGVPGVGDQVYHPHHGYGDVTETSAEHVSVAFDTGARHTFQLSTPAHQAAAAPHFEPRPTDNAPAAPADNAPALPARENLNDSDTDNDLRRKLQVHYLHIQHAERDGDHRLIQAISAHHREHNIPLFTEGGHDDPELKAQLATMVARLHATQQSTTVLPYLRIRPLTANSGDNQHAHDSGVAGRYDHRDNLIEVTPDILGDTRILRTTGGFFSAAGSASVAEATVTHEYGHMLAIGPHTGGPTAAAHAQARIDRSITAAVPGTDKHDPSVEELNAWMKRNEAPVINHVGTYAATNGDELMAELYTEYKLARTPSKAAQLAGQYLENML